MHDLIFVFFGIALLGVCSYGTQVAPLEPAPKNLVQLGLVLGFLAFVGRHYGLL